MATTKNSKNKKGVVEKIKKGAAKLKQKAVSAVCVTACDNKKTKGAVKKVATSKTTTKRKSTTKKSS